MQAESSKKQSFDAMITEIRNYGFFVELPEFILSGLIHLSDLDDDFYILDEARNLLRGKSTKKIYKVGQKIKVVVSKVDLFKQQIDFKAVS